MAFNYDLRLPGCLLDDPGHTSSLVGISLFTLMAISSQPASQPELVI
jgi:hypothetical protein